MATNEWVEDAALGVLAHQQWQDRNTMSVLYVEMPDAALRWAGAAMTGADGGCISSSTPEPLPADEARALSARLLAQGRRAVLYRKEGKRLIITN